MTGVATIVVLVLAVATMVVTGVRAARDLPAERPELATAAVLELAVLVYVVVRVVDLVGGHRPSSVGIVVAYLVGTLLVMPLTAALGYAERSRWGPIVLGVGALVVCVLLARVDQLWSAGG